MTNEYSVASIYASVEHFFGVLCPMLSLLSLLHSFELLQWSGLLFLWLGWGHCWLYFHQIYPKVDYRPFFQGLFVVGVGLLWPLWSAHYAPPR